MLLLAALSLSWHCVQAALPPADPVPGGIALQEIMAPTGSRAMFGQYRVMLLGSAESRTAVIGIPLATPPGVHNLRVVLPSGSTKNYPIRVEEKHYATQHITLANKRMVNPTAEDLKRIGRERQLIERALTNWRDMSAPQLRFELPTSGRVSDTFGLRRFFNQQPRKPHSGLDIAAPRGTPVVAPAAGRVIATGNYFFNGKTIFIDHGQGLVSMLCHLEAIEVEPDTQISQGYRIGQVGSSGRATGPHLHWGVSLNRAMVDPRLLLASEDLAGPEQPPANSGQN